MSLSKTFLLVLLFISFSQILMAQENVLKPKTPAKEVARDDAEYDYYPIGFGIEAGINYNMFSQTLSWESEVPQSIFNVFKSASGISPYFAVAADFPINGQMGIQAKIAYDGRSYSNTYTGVAEYYDFVNLVYLDGDEEQKLEITGADISISALFRYNFARNLVLTVGPMISLPAGDYTQKLTQTSLSEGRYFYDEEGNAYKVNVRTDKITDIKTRFGLDLGLGYKIPLSSSMTLIPQVRFNFMLSKITDDQTVVDNSRAVQYGEPFLHATDAKLQTLKFGIGLWF